MTDTAWPPAVPDPDDRTSRAKVLRWQLVAEWLVTPKTLRAAHGMPSTQAEVADLLGVHEVTLSNWKRDPKFQDFMARQVRSNLAADDLSAVVQNLVRIARGDTPQAVPAAREVLRWYKESKPSGREDKDLSDLSDAELEDMLNGD